MSPARPDKAEVIRYIANGLAATAVHFAVLALCMDVLHVPLAGMANAAGSAVGITVSFIGSRHWVYRGHGERWTTQAGRFGLLYACIAVLHALVLFLWSDAAGFDYRAGFLLATALQVALTYWGNKRLVFSQAAERCA